MNAALLELQLEPEDKIQFLHDRQLQRAIPGVRPANAAVAAGDSSGDASSSLTRQDDDRPGVTATHSGQVSLPCLWGACACNNESWNRPTGCPKPQGIQGPRLRLPHIRQALLAKPGLFGF